MLEVDKDTCVLLGGLGGHLSHIFNSDSSSTISDDVPSRKDIFLFHAGKLALEAQLIIDPSPNRLQRSWAYNKSWLPLLQMIISRQA